MRLYHELEDTPQRETEEESKEEELWECVNPSMWECINSAVSFSPDMPNICRTFI